LRESLRIGHTQNSLFGDPDTTLFYKRKLSPTNELIHTC